MFEMSVDWYDGRMAEDWMPPSVAEAETLFAAHGLTGRFWSLGTG